MRCHNLTRRKKMSDKTGATLFLDARASKECTGAAWRGYLLSEIP